MTYVILVPTTTKLQKIFVWYASYGSNMDMQRFLCYIKGGKVNIELISYLTKFQLILRNGKIFVASTAGCRNAEAMRRK